MKYFYHALFLVTTGNIFHLESIKIKDSIKVVYTADISSSSLTIISLFSVLEFVDASKIQFYIVASGASLDEAKNTALLLSKALFCLSNSYIRIITYVHPPSSPLFFSKSAVSSSTPHWFSSTETLRLLIPKLFDFDRYIYFDNDVIVTKSGILDSLWNREIDPESVVAICMEKLAKSEAKQIIKSYFNNSVSVMKEHFLLDNTDRISESKPVDNSDANSHDDAISIFNEYVPYFPNNGVMLVNATKWRNFNLTDRFMSLAAKVRQDQEAGKPHLAFGSQPFMLVLLRDQMMHLPPV